MNQFTTIIECGIGSIEYFEPDNLQLQTLMEAFAEKIKQVGALEVERLLS